MADPGLLLRDLAETDRRGAVWCAVLCAVSVAHLVPPSERRPGRARLLAAAWAVGLPVNEVRLRDARDAATDAAYADADAAAGVEITDAPVYSAARYAALAAFCAANTVLTGFRGFVANADRAVGYAVDAAAVAVPHTFAPDYAATRVGVRDRHLAALHDLVVHQTTPITPTPRDIRAARPGPAVVWDTAACAAGPVRIGTLGDALARARRLRLRWHDPVERAIAERLPEGHPALDALRADDAGRADSP